MGYLDMWGRDKDPKTPSDVYEAAVHRRITTQNDLGNAVEILNSHWSSHREQSEFLTGTSELLVTAALDARVVTAADPKLASELESLKQLVLIHLRVKAGMIPAIDCNYFPRDSRSVEADTNGAKVRYGLTAQAFQMLIDRAAPEQTQGRS